MMTLFLNDDIDADDDGEDDDDIDAADAISF